MSLSCSALLLLLLVCRVGIVISKISGIVIACGDNTVMGHIAGLTARIQPNKSPIAKELDRFMKLISIWACCLGTGCGLAAIILKYDWIDAALFLIGIIVANVPEGLPRPHP